ncbi:unnamed protein product [Rotaria sp. Silwood2]|nr:unnamed protein product [Rotaria sp. Silwood2]CAF4722408.1 unnamed protein product [Rotaria sp. Silwood2]
MAHNYIRKRCSPAYNEEEMLNAILKIKSGEWTYKQTSAITKFSKGALSARISQGSLNQVGRPTALTHDEEAYLMNLIETL